MFRRLRSLFGKSSVPSPSEWGELKKKGDLHLKQGQLDQALDCFERALLLHSNCVDAIIGIGYILSEREQIPAAEIYLRQALSLDPSAHDAYYILGTIAVKRQDWDAAIECFAHAIKIRPDFEFPYRDLYFILHQRGEVLQAMEVVQKAISAFPGSVEFAFYLSTLLAREKKFPEAIANYRNTLSAHLDSAIAHKNMADLLELCGQLEIAIESYQTALRLEPKFIDAHIALGNTLERSGRIEEAIACYRRAIALGPQNAAAHEYLGNALIRLGATEQALSSFERVVQLEPENSVSHLVAALSGRHSDHPPDDYVRRLFDDYAENFDSHLVKRLDYKVPDQLAHMLQPYAQSAAQKWQVLDLGCGTGLFGKAVAAFAQGLVGVDLSPKMLEKARALNIYDRLEEANLQVMMRAEENASYDLVSATDVLIYVGKLDELLMEVSRLLRPGGFFVFSIESPQVHAAAHTSGNQSQDFQLTSSGRYAHSIAYLDRLASSNGFEPLVLTESKIRDGKGKPLQGYLVIWRRQ